MVSPDARLAQEAVEWNLPAEGGPRSRSRHTP
jgi:hypothetical protein